MFKSLDLFIFIVDKYKSTNRIKAAMYLNWLIQYIWRNVCTCQTCKGKYQKAMVFY